MFDQRGKAFGKGIEVVGRTVNPAGSVLTPLRVRIPAHVTPHLLKEDIRPVPLAPVEDLVEDEHFGAVPGETTLFGFMDALLDLHPVEVQAQPAGMAIDLVPGGLVSGRGVRSPAAPAVALELEYGIGLLGIRQRLLDRMPGSANPSPHGVGDVAQVEPEANVSARSLLAPPGMNGSGYADLLAKGVAGADWILGRCRGGGADRPGGLGHRARFPPLLG